MQAFDLMVPVNFNNGSLIPDSIRESLESTMVELFGGFTHNPANMTGVWRDTDGTIYRDTINIYTIFSDDSRDILTMAHVVADLCEQLAVSVIFPDRSAHIIDRA